MQAPGPQRKKAKKEKQAPQEQVNGSGIPCIQDEVQDLEPAKILNKRTRSSKTVALHNLYLLNHLFLRRKGNMLSGR